MRKCKNLRMPLLADTFEPALRVKGTVTVEGHS